MIRAFDPSQVVVQLNEHILRNLFGQTAIARHAQRQREHHRLELVHELFKIRLPVMGHCLRVYSLIRKSPRGGMQRIRD